MPYEEAARSFAKGAFSGLPAGLCAAAVEIGDALALDDRAGGNRFPDRVAPTLDDLD